MDNVISDGCIARPLGRLEAFLGDLETATGHLEHGLAVNQRVGAPYWFARAQLGLADVVRDERPPQARELAAAALSTATMHGYTQLEQFAQRAFS